MRHEWRHDDVGPHRIYTFGGSSIGSLGSNKLSHWRRRLAATKFDRQERGITETLLFTVEAQRNIFAFIDRDLSIGGKSDTILDRACRIVRRVDHDRFSV